jgi:hypothetical protein
MVIEAMREFERETDRWPRSSDWAVACEDWPSAGTVYNRFGSWKAERRCQCPEAPGRLIKPA